MKTLSLFLIIVFLLACNLDNKKGNYNVIVNENGQVQKITVFHKTDSTVIDFYPNAGGVENIARYKNGIPRENKIELYKNGGIRIIYQLVPHADSSLMGQVYMFDSKQCLIENGSAFAIVSRDSNYLSTIKYMTGIGLDSVNVYEITEHNIETNSFLVRKEINIGLGKDGRFPIVTLPKSETELLFKFIGTKQKKEFNFFY